MPKWEIGKTYKTVDGRDAKLVYMMDEKQERPLVFVIGRKDGTQFAAERDEQGCLLRNGHNNYFYNVVPPEPDKTSRFVNVYRNSIGGSYETIDQARRMIPTWKRSSGVLEIQFEDGEYVGTVFHPVNKGEDK